MKIEVAADKVWFQVPTPAGLVDVIVPAEMSAADANVAAARIAAIVRAMFSVVADDGRLIGVGASR